MTWPTSSKASTTNVDSGGDTISAARPDIKQNIDNVNAIIDTFDISSPNNNDTLKYNSTSGKFETQAGAGAGSTIVIEVDSTVSVASTATAVFNTYGGGFTILGTNAMGVTTSTSAGKSTLVFPAGTYSFESIVAYISGSYGADGVQQTITSQFKDNTSNSVLFAGVLSSLSFYFNQYQIGTTATFASATTVYLDLKVTAGNGTGTFAHPDIIINRLA